MIVDAQLKPSVETSGLDRTRLVGMLRKILLIRAFENAAARGYAEGKIGGFLHLYNGQEASAVGAMAALRQDDFVMAYYRHGHAIARGVPTDRLMAELHGKVDGVARGRGGSMHFYSDEHRYLGGWAIVGGQLPLAVGRAWATEYRRNVLDEPSESIGLVVCGDGATNIGYFYEALNFAAIWDAPIVFVVENNLYGMGGAVSNVSALASMAEKACMANIPSSQVDGMDVLAVHDAVAHAADYARSERKPILLEILSYRYRAHSMADPELYRDKAEIERWQERDPAIRFPEQLIASGLVTPEEVEATQLAVDEEIRNAVAFAEASLPPPTEEMYADIVAEPPPPIEPSGDTRPMTTTEALNAALDEWMALEPRAFVMGEDVNEYGGAYGVTRHLPEKYGPERVRDTPIAEGAIVQVAAGAAMAGLRPIAELMTVNFALLASDGIINHAAKVRSMFGGQANVPLVVRTVGGGVQLAATHSQNFDTLFAHVPGLRVAAPATPFDAKGLLATALRLDDPTVILEHQLLYRLKAEVPVGVYTLPVGMAHVEREGDPGGVTLVGYSRGLQIALQAADKLAEQHGVRAEVVNLRWLRPLDTETIVRSVKKTNRLVVVEDDWRSYGVGAEVAARVQEEAFDWLDAPILRVAAEEVPLPYAANLEQAAWPSVDKILSALRALHVV